MERDILSQVAAFLLEKRRTARWRKVVSVLAMVVVFCTTYALILPAITMERETVCGLEEHTHTEDCYRTEILYPQSTMNCSAETLGVHTHDGSCYDGDGSLICGYADFALHTHDAYCYSEDGSLICTLPEIKVHTHTARCYTEKRTLLCEEEEELGHTHSEVCYKRLRGDLICKEEETEGHTHTEACYEITRELTCANEEEGHEHDDFCYTEHRELVCGQEEYQGHQHTDECYDWTSELICTEEEREPGHVHDDSCYLIEQVLTCGREEIVLHTHDSGCYDDSGSLICGKLETQAHQHTDECVLPPVGEPEEVQVLTCRLEEHTHDETCYKEETPPAETGLVIPEGLPILGTVRASGGGWLSYGIALLADDYAENPVETTGPLDVEDYVTYAALSYRTDDSADWRDVESAADIPGDADFRLDIDYSNVPIDDLIAAGGEMTYTLPDLLRNPSANGKITSGSTEVGIITVDGSTVTLTFDLNWLQEQKASNATVISGDFYVEAEADLSQVEDGKPGQIVVGDVTITIDFEDDIVAQYGNVDIVKNSPAFLQEADGSYLEYTLTVTAGADGCPDVKVVDTFTANQAYVEAYVGVTGLSTSTNDTDGPQETSSAAGAASGDVYIGAAPTADSPIPDPAGEDAEKPGTLVWEVGDMQANETRTLTYRVKVTDDYTGITSKGTIQNTADVYSKTYERDSDTANFTPKAEATMSKISAAFVPDENGGGTITYTVWVQAGAGNTYTLDNVKIVDALDGTEGSTATDSGIRKYLYYDETSFHLYAGGVKNQNGSSGLKEINEGTGPVFTDADGDTKNNDSFAYYIGSLAPGECKTLTYTVNVEPGVFAAADNTVARINNRARIYTDDAASGGGQVLNAYNATNTLSRKVWDRKLAGEKQETAMSVPMSGSVYDATGSSITSDANPGSFTVPVGSYQYRVVANEAGDWDVSSASLKDTLGSQNMQFVGYVQVNAYTITDNAPSSNLTDESVIANLSARTPDQTTWIKVDGLRSFEFTPAEVGLNGNYAYLLTYYAQPVATEGITQIVVSNEFSLEGEVGIGDSQYILTGITVSASVTVEGSNHFGAEKLSWYYEAPQVTSGDWSNGALYWVIKVDGSIIPDGTQIRDITNAAGGTLHYIRGTSLAGVYTSSLSGSALTGYRSWSALQSSGRLTELDTGAYTVETNNTSLTLQFLRDVTLTEGESLYIIVKTEPSSVPSGKRDSKTFSNKLQSSSDGTTWFDHNTASQTLYGSENVFKELGRVFTYTGSGSITDIQGGTKQAIDTAALNGEAGTYAAWQIHVNYEGNLSGRYRVIDEIPAGMELAYVRIWWIGDRIRSSPPTVNQLTSEELAVFGSGWTEHVLTTSTINFGQQTTYYYTDGRQVLWDIGDLVAGGERDTYAVEFQIVCRVTDPDVLLGSESRTFNNNVSLHTVSGQNIGVDSNGVTIQRQTLSKTSTYDPDTNGGRYPFRITLNELGEDLVDGSDTITLVDELSDTLTLDITSLHVVNTKTDEEVTGWTSSVEGQTLKLVLPDDLPLTVTYETLVNAAPGQEVSISNSAHWEGYTSPSGGSVSDENFRYTVGGTVGVTANPSLKIIKMDQYNNQMYLEGAEFTLTEGAYEDGVFTVTAGGLTLTGATGEDGVLTFGKEAGQVMKYNTVYRLEETRAPAGYVLDRTPHDFVIAQQLTGENGAAYYPDFPDGVAVWYQGAEYTYQAYNHKGEASVKKIFQGGDGKEISSLTGTYRFGIYDNQNSAGAPLQTVTITYGSGTVTPAGGIAKFAGLELGETYYIYELDDAGLPIPEGSTATVGGKMFDVTYGNGNTVTVPAGGTPAETVTVANQVHYTSLPETGGPGTWLHTAAGLLLTCGAAWLFCQDRRRGKERADHTF